MEAQQFIIPQTRVALAVSPRVILLEHLVFLLRGIAFLVANRYGLQSAMTVHADSAGFPTHLGIPLSMRNLSVRAQATRRVSLRGVEEIIL